MTKYLTFLINKETVGIKYSDQYELEQTHINKVFANEDKEYIHYRGEFIPVYDTGELLGLEPLKKFDGLLFVHIKEKTLAFKTEGFFKLADNVKKEINPLAISS
jgi:hypothetical protein